MEQDPKQKDTNTQKDTAKGHAGLYPTWQGIITARPSNHTQPGRAQLGVCMLWVVGVISGVEEIAGSFIP